MNYFTAEEDSKILLADSIAETARELGRNYDSVRKRRKKLTASHSDNGVKRSIEEESERLERARRIREEREALFDVAKETSLRAKLESMIKSYVPSFPRVPAPKKKIPQKATTESVVLCLSDWHAGELVDSERTRGINNYDSATLSRRVSSIVNGACSIRQKLEKGSYRMKTLSIAGGGDFLSGTIHELERHSDHRNVMECAMWLGGEVLPNAILQLSEGYDSVDFFGVSGNHGRLPDARRVQQKDPTRNWDTLVYLVAQKVLVNQKQIKFHIPYSYSLTFDVFDWRFLLSHGHDVKSWNSVPYYGVNRLISNTNAIESGRGKPINYYLLSHFHSLSSLPHATGEVFINGSLIGATEFSINALGKADRPQQLMLMVHPEHGVTSRWSIYA